MQFSKNKHSNSVKRLIYKRKTAVFIPAACIGDPNAMNFELLLSPEYYLAIMSLYEEIKRNNVKSLQLLQTFDNDIKLNNEKRGSTKLIYNACLIITN